jgi:hypothetical protein
MAAPTRAVRTPAAPGRAVAGVVDGAITVAPASGSAVSLYVRTGSPRPGGARELIELVVDRAEAAALGAAISAWAASAGAAEVVVPCRVGVRLRADGG